jgi:hypothetical protein
MSNINLKDPLIIVALIIGLLVLFGKILPMFFSIAANLFWVAIFIGIVLFVYPPTRNIITNLVKKVFIK